MANRHNSYMPGIDGLRAVAVIGVIVYHLFPSLIPGGFVGVDVFFVISGYLITGIILREILDGRFSFLEFYKRRAVRILPPLIAMLAFVLIAGWFYLTPDEFKNLGRHGIAGLLFLSNFQLLSEVGYFDTSSELKPLLHLWSLGIEEQFYIVWPVLLILVFRGKAPANWRLPALCIVTFSSLLFCLFATPVDASKAFYHPFARIWEMGAGALLQVYFLVGHRREIFDSENLYVALFRKYAGPVGLFLILFSYFAFNTSAPFPGWRALIPVAGSLLVLLSLQFSVASKLLENRVSVGIGKVSYSLYLWHWPPIALGHIVFGQNIPSGFSFFAISFAVAAAVSSYFFVEKPIRFGRLVPRFGAVKVIGLPSLAVLVLSVVIFSGGWAARAQHDFLNDVRLAKEDWAFPGKLMSTETDGGRIYFSKPNFQTLVVGDSNAEQYVGRFLKLEESGALVGGFGFLTRSSCPPLPLVKRSRSQQCDGFFEAIQSTLKSQPGIQRVVFAAQWAGYLWSDEYYREDGKPLSESFLSLKQFALDLRGRGVKAGIVLNMPIDERFMPERTFRRDVLGHFTQLREPIDFLSIKDIDRTNNLLREAFSDSQLIVADPVVSLCPGGKCQTVDHFEKPIYKDCCHLRAAYVENHANWIDQFAD